MRCIQCSLVWICSYVTIRSITRNKTRRDYLVWHKLHESGGSCPPTNRPTLRTLMYFHSSPEFIYVEYFSRIVAPNKLKYRLFAAVNKTRAELQRDRWGLPAVSITMPLDLFCSVYAKNCWHYYYLPTCCVDRSKLSRSFCWCKLRHAIAAMRRRPEHRERESEEREGRCLGWL